MLARVSNLEAFRRWRLNEDQSIEDLVRWITTDDPSPAMLAGTAFHKAMEQAEPGEFDTLTANGYTFQMPEAEIDIPQIREVRTYGDYGGLTVTGQADCVVGRTVIDHKTTARFNAETYLAGFQWRFYLDLFEADIFRWNVFEITETEPKVYRVGAPQILIAHRYPEMHNDCMRLAGDYLDFAKRYLPDTPHDPLPHEYLGAE